MPTLETADGTAVDVTPVDTNTAFAAAMNDTGPDASAPPKRAPAAEVDQPKRRGRPPKVPKAEQARTTPARPVVALDDEARHKGVQGLVQIGAGLTLMYAKASHKQAFLADSVTIANSAPQWAGACVDIARTDAKFAAALDKVCASGPFAALITVAVGTSLQLVRNHRPELTTLPGTVHPDVLLDPQKEEINESVRAAA
jgi:hypothetical protein